MTAEIDSTCCLKYLFMLVLNSLNFYMLQNFGLQAARFVYIFMLINSRTELRGGLVHTKVAYWSGRILQIFNSVELMAATVLLFSIASSTSFIKTLHSSHSTGLS